MTVTFYRLRDEGAEYDRVAVVEDGELAEGEDEIPPLAPEELEDEERLVERYDGPRLVATVEDETVERGYWITEPRRGIVGKVNPDSTFRYNGSDSAVEQFLSMDDPSGLNMTKASLVPRTGREDNLLKQGEDSWIPYQGPQGGEGWQQVSSGTVRYQQEPPGEVAEGYDESHWQQNWPELEGTEWNTDLPSILDMKDGDTVLFVNRDGASEVAEIVGSTFVRREGWDSAKQGVKLRDGREVTLDSISAYAPTASVVEPPELEGEAEWEEAPGVWNRYNSNELVHFRNGEGEPEVGIVEGGAGDRGAVKVQTTEQFQVVDTDNIYHRAAVEDDFNRGYAILDSPFEDVPDVEFSIELQPEFASEMGATVEDVEDAFQTVFGPHLVDDLERELSKVEEDYDRDDPEEWLRAIINMRGTDEANAYADFRWEIRGRANGLGMNRVERIIDEAFALDISDPSHDIRQKFDGEEKNQPEEWLKAAADFAIEEEAWVSIGKLQDAVDDWSGTIPFSAKNLHDHEGEPDEIVPISESGSNAGISAGAMFIAEWPDGGRAYITRIRDEHDHGNFHSKFMEPSSEAERAMTGYELQKELNESNETIEYPEHEYRYDEFLSVNGAPEGAVLADKYMDEKPTEGVEMPEGFPDNDIVESLGADVGDVQAAVAEVLQPGWVEEIEEIIENDPNLNTENPADWVAGAKQEYDADRARVWNKFTEALAQESYTAPVDRGDYMDLAAAAIIAGNRDLHSKNVMADDEGTLYPIDLDRSGYDMTEDRYLSEGVGKLVSTANALGIEASEEFADEGNPNAFDKAKRPLGHEILAHIEQYAQEETSSEEVTSGNPMYAARQMGDKVERNFEAAREGELQL